MRVEQGSEPRCVLGLLVLLLGAATAIADDEGGPAAVGNLSTAVELAGHEGMVRTLAFHPEGAVLASGGPDRTLRLWNVEQARAIATLRLPQRGCGP